MILSHAPYRNYYWGINGVSLIFFYYEINNSFLQILLQDKYNIGVLTVNIEFMRLATKRVERLAKARSFPHFSALPHKFYIYRQYTNIVYLSLC
jgi:hypothetical protein